MAPDPDCASAGGWPDEVHRLLTDFPGRAYADMADVPMRLDPATGELDRDTRALASKFKQKFGPDPAVKSGLMYGSDFPFTVLEGASVDYRRGFERALGSAQGFGFNEEEIEDVMWRNASRFLGLTRNGNGGAWGEPARRLVEFHHQAAFDEGGRKAPPNAVRREVMALLEPFLVRPNAVNSGRSSAARGGQGRRATTTVRAAEADRPSATWRSEAR